MKRFHKLLGSAGIVLVIAAAILGTIAWQEFYGQTGRVDRSLYADGEPNSVREVSTDRYAQALKRFVDPNGLVDYAGLKASPGDLEAYLRDIAFLDRKVYAGWKAPRKIAFWVNAYNALALKVIVDHYPIKPRPFKSLAYPTNSIRQIPGVFDRITCKVMGREMTLDGIEHETLRKEFDEPRIHVALVCAAMSCPPLRNEPYFADRLDAQLDDQARRFLSKPQNFRIDRDAGEVHLSSIFSWFGKDFVSKHLPGSGFAGHSKAERAVLAWAAGYLSDADARYLRDGNFDVEYIDYDWSLNEQRKPDKPDE